MPDAFQNLYKYVCTEFFPASDYKPCGVEIEAYTTLVKCVLETGRTHQIRAHMRHLGHPLFCDERYGGNQILKGSNTAKYRQFIDNCFKLCPRQVLHAKTLGFVHPITGQEMLFDSEWPDDMKALMNKWRNYLKTEESASAL